MLPRGTVYCAIRHVINFLACGYIKAQCVTIQMKPLERFSTCGTIYCASQDGSWFKV